MSSAYRLIVDAADRRLGNVASEVASLLRGKDRTDFDPARKPQRRVVIINAGRLSVRDEKRLTAYRRHTGYPGHLKTRRLGERMATDVEGVVRDAVAGMLPKNRLRRRLLSSLTVYRAGESK